MTTSVSISELSSRWSDVLQTIQAGGEVVVTDGKVEQARLVPLATQNERKPGSHLGDFKMAPDFNDELPDAFWLGEE